MPTLPLREVARIARALGHRDLNVRAAGRVFVATCSCGYKSAQRRTDVLAAQAAAHHLELIIKKWQAAGSHLPAETPEIVTSSRPRPSEPRTSDTPLLEHSSESQPLRLV